MDTVYEFIKPYLESDEEFEVRFAVVMLLTFYINEIYIDDILLLLDKILNRAYYVSMGIAWANSICYVKFPHKTEIFLNTNNLDDFTHNKSIQKITESLRIDKDTKIRVKKLLRK